MAFSRDTAVSRPGTVLVTGGCGFIGTNLVRYLAERGCQLKVLDNLSTGIRENLAPSLRGTLITGDIRDRDVVAQAVQGVEAVVHLAARTSVVESLENPGEVWDINVGGTLNMLEACRQNGVSRFVLASSNAVVGEQPPPINEQQLPQPLSPYGASKMAGEALCSSYYHSFGLNTFPLRFANCYGPYSEHKTSIIPKLIKWADAGNPITVYGDGSQTRDFIHAGDIAQAIYLALTVDMDSYGHVFQIATGIETSINQLVALIQEVAGRKLQVIYEAERKGEIKRNYSDITKARRMLGFNPEITLGEGLKDMWGLRAVS